MPCHCLVHKSDNTHCSQKQCSVPIEMRSKRAKDWLTRINAGGAAMRNRKKGTSHVATQLIFPHNSERKTINLGSFGASGGSLRSQRDERARWNEETRGQRAGESVGTGQSYGAWRQKQSCCLASPSCFRDRPETMSWTSFGHPVSHWQYSAVCTGTSFGVSHFTRATSQFVVPTDLELKSEWMWLHCAFIHCSSVAVCLTAQYCPVVSTVHCNSFHSILLPARSPLLSSFVCPKPDVPTSVN